MTLPAAIPLPDPPLLFDAVLYPHRSLSPRGFWILMALVSAVSFTAGLAFFLIGAWPVVGFFGLDVLLIFVAFRLSYRAARMMERIKLSADALQIERVSPYGQVRRWSFQPYWVRVVLDDPPLLDSVVTIGSHGRSVGVGGFLVPGEKAEFASALRAALQTARRPGPEPAGISHA